MKDIEFDVECNVCLRSTMNQSVVLGRKDYQGLQVVPAHLDSFKDDYATL